MKIAILGTRGIPANYGGFETFAEELSTRLAARGHDVVVYGRTNNIRYHEPVYRSVRLTLLPTIPHKYLDTVAHTFLSVLHVLFRDVQVVLICNAANSIFSWIPRLAGKKVVVNVDGIERQRRKWNALGRAWYRLGEWFSTWMPNAIVSDARVIREYYRERYKKESFFIPYGADTQREETRETLDRLGLEPEGYFLYVSRLEPENNALLVIQAFERVATDKKLVIVGDAPYASDYIAKLKVTIDRRVLFPGAIYGTGYRELQSHAFCYIHATEVGGTHPALLEAMARGRCVLYLNTPENREVAAEAAIHYEKSPDDLAAKITRVLNDAAQREQHQHRARRRVAELYQWDTVTTQYEILFEQLLSQPMRQEELRVQDISFLGEHDGGPEQLLTNRLATLFRDGGQGIARAYLAQARYAAGGRVNIVLALRTWQHPDKSIVHEIHGIFGGIFNSEQHLDIVFLKEEQEIKLREVCAPFFENRKGDRT